MTDDPFDALFDDELRALTDRTRELLGEDGCIAAIDRATAAVGGGPVTSIEDMDKFREALKAELRRVIVLH